MRLRKLEKKDIPLIYEWMTDSQINSFFRFDPTKVSYETICSFVENAQDTQQSCYWACVDENDVYLGTIGFKNINLIDKTAEYTIAFRKSAQGTGAARFATKKALEIAFGQMNLEKIYLNVLAENNQAIRFYEKFGFEQEGLSRKAIVVQNERRDLYWYGMLKEKFHE